MNSSKGSQPVSNISSFVPCQAFSPLLMKTMFSPISITEFMSCVLTMVVMLNSWVMSWISWSISKEVFGSSPEFGSSQNRYLGFSTIALAMAALFCIPPLISAGDKSSAWDSSTRSKQNLARSIFSSSVISVNMSNGNFTFSSTLMESKSAEPWKSMPISRLSALSSFRFMEVMFRPSYSISPESMRWMPTTLFISTVFPEPLCPMMRLVFPVSKMVDTSLRTVFPSNDFMACFTSIIAVAWLT